MKTRWCKESFEWCCCLLATADNHVGCRLHYSCLKWDDCVSQTAFLIMSFFSCYTNMQMHWEWRQNWERVVTGILFFSFLLCLWSGPSWYWTWKPGPVCWGLRFNRKTLETSWLVKDVGGSFFAVESSSLANKGKPAGTTHECPSLFLCQLFSLICIVVAINLAHKVVLSSCLSNLKDCCKSAFKGIDFELFI